MDKLKKEDYIHGGTQKDFYQENEREACDCPLCGNNAFKTVDHDRGLSIVKCEGCDLLYTNPRAKNAEMNYFGEAEAFYSEARLIFSGKKSHHRDRNYEYEIKKIQQLKPGGRLLDVGTNMGFFLRKAREAGFETEGVEPSPSLSKIARDHWNLNIHTAFLDDANLPAESYDVITLIDVFEHVTQPKEMLNTAFKLLKPDGVVAIKVPNGDYNHFKMKLARALGRTGKMDIWDCCEHVVHYTPKTFKKMADSCGFSVRKQIVPLPIHPPIWANLVGHYYQYPSPAILSWKEITLRNLFFFIGRIELQLLGKSRFGPDLMFFLKKKQ